MQWYTILLVAVLALSACGNVLLVGQRRDPKTPGQAAADVVLAALLIWAVLASA